MKNRYKQGVDNKMHKSLSLRMGSRLREGWFLICVMMALFLFFALLTYHASDPGWSSTGMGNRVLNWGGRVGAWVADICLLLFGLLAYLFPCFILLSSWFWLKGRQIGVTNDDEAVGRHERLLTLLGWFFLITSTAGLLHFYAKTPKFLPTEAGGIVGNVIGNGLSLLFNQMGSTLLFLTIFLCGMTLVTGLSWLALVDRVGEYVVCGVQWIIKNSQRQFLTLKQKLVLALQRKPKVLPVKPTHLAAMSPSSMRIEPERDEPILALAPVLNKTPPKSKEALPELIAAPVVSPPMLKSVEAQSLPKPQDKVSRVNPESKVAYGELPSLDLLNSPATQSEKPFASLSFTELSQLVEQRLADFGVAVHVVAVHPGPVITRFELDLAPGIKVSKITGLAKDIARSLSTVSVRVVEVIPGKSLIGLEIPNEHREWVTLREILESPRYLQSQSPLSLVLGKDISGNAVVVDLAKMPHLLVAGTTGSGKSVSLNAMLVSMLYKATPERLRFIMIDPKMLELSIYDGIPHLLTPVITDMKNAANALRWCVAEMDRRYRLMAALGVRNLASYNQQVEAAIQAGQPLLMPGSLVTDAVSAQTSLEPLPMIAVIVDELADMMMVVGKKVEDLIARIAQKARAAGIHLILATQRPSVDVITGLIKANIPTRIAFQVSSRIDSRTILDQQGAEQLLGHGDMLYLPPGAGIPTRVHGAYVADEEVHRVVAAWRSYGEPRYIQGVTDECGESEGSADSQLQGERDALYDEAVRIVVESRRASISLVQRRLRIGYNRAARMMEEMESAGIVSSMDNTGSREVLVGEATTP